MIIQQPIYNLADEEIPAFGVVQIAGAAERRGQVAIDAIKPDGEIRPSMYLINGPTPLPPQRLGLANVPLVATWAFYQIVGETADFDQDWGPFPGSWKLDKRGTGFQILGNPEKERVLVRMQIGPQLFMARVDEANGIQFDQIGTFNLLDGEKSQESEFSESSAEAYVYFGNLNDNTRAIIGHIGGDWEAVVGECS